MVVHPADGGVVSSLRFKPAGVELINSLARRPEPAHELVRRHAKSQQSTHEGPASIHQLVASKEANLDSLLRYDHYARHSFRTYVFSAFKQCEDFEYLRLEENKALAGGRWDVTVPAAAAPAGTIVLERSARLRSNGNELQLNALKTLSAKAIGSRWQLECRSSLSTNDASTPPLAFGVELVFNLLAPNAPDRYILADGVRHPLSFAGEIAASSLALVDEWQRVSILLEAEPEALWWIAPIETVSQSESGFERVYQGSAILAVWKIEPRSGKIITCTLRAQVSQVERRRGMPRT
jgi:alpha-amylase